MVYWINGGLLLAIEIIHEFPSRQIDFVIAFTQAYIYMDVFMELPLVMLVDGNRGEWVLNLNKLLYGINQASTNWFYIINTGLERSCCHQSQVDPCLFYIKW